MLATSVLLALAGCVDDPEIAAEEAALTWPQVSVDTMVTSRNADASGNDGGCWDLPLGLPSGSVKWLQQFPCHARNNQLWRFEWRGSGFRIRSRHDSNLCLDLPGGNRSAGQDVQLFPCHDGTNQLWLVDQTDDTSSTIHPFGGPSLCLDVENATRTNLARIQIYGCHGGANQEWRFHTRVDSDGKSCSSTVRFGASGPTVSSGGSRSFHVTGHNFDVSCPLPSPSWSHVDCDDAETDWFVVDRLGGAGGYTIRCFHTDQAPSSPSPGPGLPDDPCVPEPGGPLCP